MAGTSSVLTTIRILATQSKAPLCSMDVNSRRGFHTLLALWSFDHRRNTLPNFLVVDRPLTFGRQVLLFMLLPTVFLVIFRKSQVSLALGASWYQNIAGASVRFHHLVPDGMVLMIPCTQFTIPKFSLLSVFGSATGPAH